MRLLRVQVPEFRALKDVDISFEPDFYPQVFPLGSLNGGGKSTLLQLIFIVLNYIDRPGIDFFKNIVTGLQHDYNREDTYTFIEITILINNERLIIGYYYGYADKIVEFRKAKENNTSICHWDAELYDKTQLLGFITFLDRDISSKIDSTSIYFIKQDIINKVFLISPSNQPYLFLSRETRRLLFVEDLEKTYEQTLKSLKNHLPNFFTYDFVDVLAEVFRLARDKDYEARNKDNPFEYSEKLENDINNLFIDGKKIVPLTVQQKRHTKDSIQGVTFRLPNSKEIYPEDLSHGELKRLAIFVLIKYHEIENSIVLMDEVENGFHPDWQYSIVRDLIDWGKNNQYILATHSYELCNAVTPAHVKELEPRLTKS